MKLPQLFVVMAASFLAVGCATYQEPSAQPHSQAAPAGDVSIISAIYGSGTHYADVTDRVDELLHPPYHKFFARPEWLEADPTPGWNKALVIVYLFKGHRQIFTTGEGGEVNISILQGEAIK